ncbi:hypothetical protein HDV04_005171 [Boothiomyces sp. JEL0838]|nr:hypothetical protein HDV04_005171 [Boothiomyces sp. JEL0838]
MQVLALLIATAFGATVPCQNVETRVEWRRLSPTDQSAYIQAVRCLKFSIPSRLPTTSGSYSLYDDFVYIHNQAVQIAHSHPRFLPWHRLMLATYNSFLRSECQYNGPMPYWDWTLDSQAPELSPVWAPNAFGGNGDPTYGCLQGSFADFYKRDINNPQQFVCVQRRWANAANPLQGAYVAPVTVQWINQQSTTYDLFRTYMETYPHNTVHASICGDMCDPRVSVNDPIFFMHHGNVDRLWSVWQNSNPLYKNAYGGSGADANVAVTDLLNMFGLTNNLPVRELLSTTAGGADGRMCYVYDNTTPTAAPSNVAPVTNNSNVSKRNNISPHPFDRTDKVNIRYVEPLSIDFLKRWKYTDKEIKFIRKVEEKVRKLTDHINLDPEYISPVRLEVLEKAVQNGWVDKTPEQQAKDEQAVLDAVKRAMAHI